MPDDITPPDAGDEIHLNANSRSSMLPPKDRETVLEAARKMSGEEPEPPAQPRQQTPPPKPPEPKPDPKAATPPAKPEPDKKVDEPAKEKEKPKGVAELRDAYAKQSEEVRRLNESFTTTTKEKADAMAKLAQMEEAYTKATERISKELEPQVVKLKEAEKRLQEKEDVLRMKDYTQTAEWRQKYVEPLVQANAKKNQLLAETTVTVDGPDGTKIDVAAQPEHFDYVLGAKTLTEATRRAKELWGDDIAPHIVALRTEIRDHGARQQEALKNAQLEAVEWQKNQEAAAAQNREMVRNEIFSSRKSYMDSKPELFSPKEDDNEMVSALAEGQKFADYLLNPPADLSPAQVFKRVGEANARIIESFAMKPRLTKLEAENKALREELEAYHKSEPDVRTRDGGPAPKAPTTKDEEHEMMLKAANELATSLT